MGEPHQRCTECCVCLRSTSRSTECGHPLCSYCRRRLRRLECPYCRQALPDPKEGVLQSLQKGLELYTQAVEDLGSLRLCHDFQSLHEVALGLVAGPGQQLVSVQRARAAAVTRRCCSLLEQGFASVQDAKAAAKYLAGLREDGLLHPLRSVQQAVRNALLDLYSRREPPPTIAPGPHPADRGSCDRERSDKGRMAKVRGWLTKAALMAVYREAGVVEDKAEEEMGGILKVALRSCLAGASHEELLAALDLILNGTSGLGGVARRAARPAVEDALQLAECCAAALGPQGCAAVQELAAARRELQEVGLAAAVKAKDLPSSGSPQPRRPKSASCAQNPRRALDALRKQRGGGLDVSMALKLEPLCQGTARLLHCL